MLENLPKLTGDEVQLANLAASCSLIVPKTTAWIESSQQVLSKLLSKPCKLEFKRCFVEAKPEITGSAFAVTWPPRAGLFWIEIETRLLQAGVYQTIGQALPETLDPRLSDLERGVALYWLAQVLAGTKEPFQLSDRADLPTGVTVCLSFAFRAGEQDSFVRVWVSKELVQSVVQSVGPSVDTIAKHAEERTSWASLPLCISLAQVDLKQEEFAALETGDIILLDSNVPLTLQDKAVVGEASALVGDPASKTLKGQLGLSDAGQYTFSIAEIS